MNPDPESPEDLVSSIRSSSTPARISAVCSSVRRRLHSQSPDLFFYLPFRCLIRRLYGFDRAAPSWIDVVLDSNDATLASTVFDLFSPSGVLFYSIFSADRRSRVKYAFPIERLPEWVRFILSGEVDCQVLNALCPLFRSRVKEDSVKGIQLHLNLFEIFFFWFASYPIYKANCEDNLEKRTSKFKLLKWISSFSQSRVGNEVKLECNLYVRLLYAYLRDFVPLNLHSNSHLHYGYGNDGSVLMRAEFVVDTLVHYWLVGDDFSPLPVSVCNSFGLSFPFKSVLGQTPPTPNLGELLKWLVKYLSPKGSWVSSNLFEVKSFRELANGSVVAVGSCNSCIQRPLYRYILRTFLFCPMGTSLKNASQVFSVWVTYMEPWKLGLHDFAQLDAILHVKRKDTKSKNCGYSSLWQGYVLSNYLYYTSLVMHFIGFAHKFLHTDPAGMVQMVLKLIEILTSSKELIDLIKNLDIVFHSTQAGSSNLKFHSLYEYVPLILEQLQDWEDDLRDENWNKDLRLFADGENGGQQLLELFILRAEAELQANSSENRAQNLECIDSLKKHVSCLYGAYTRDIFKPRRYDSRSMGDYRGDWMKRPICDDEVAWLAKLLIWLSNWLNERLGLDRPESSESDVGHEQPYFFLFGTTNRWSIFDFPTDEESPCGPLEATEVVLSALINYVRMEWANVVRLMRVLGVRVNLRIFALKKFLSFLVISILSCILVRKL